MTRRAERLKQWDDENALFDVTVLLSSWHQNTKTAQGLLYTHTHRCSLVLRPTKSTITRSDRDVRLSLRSFSRCASLTGSRPGSTLQLGTRSAACTQEPSVPAVTQSPGFPKGHKWNWTPMSTLNWYDLVTIRQLRRKHGRATKVKAESAETAAPIAVEALIPRHLPRSTKRD